MYGAMDDSSWQCPSCTFRNVGTVERCEICQAFTPRTNKWACVACTFVQSGDELRCEICNTPRPDRPPESHGNFIVDIDAPLTEAPRGPLIRQISFDRFPAFLRQISQRREFYCAICMSNVAETEKATLCCPHEYCKSCMENFITLEIKESRVLNVTCPGLQQDGSPCDAPFSPKDIKEIVDEKTWEKYERFVKMKTDDSYVACPRCNQLQKGSRFNPIMNCERKECNTEFCFIHSGAHKGETCAQYKKRTREEFKRDVAFVSETAINCPNICCRTPISKVSGCNHMSCTQCGAEFCYLCGGWYMLGFHFSEYNCLGCPDMQSAGGEPKNRATCARLTWRCIAWPFVLLCCSLPLAIIMALFICFQSCWLAFFILCCPCLAIYKCIMRRNTSLYITDHNRFNQLACMGPVACGYCIRGCGCGFPCACCLRSSWLCPK